MSEQMADAPGDGADRVPEPRVARKGPLLLIRRTLAKAWEGNIFSEAAEAAFWQTLSLPPLLLGLLGALGFLGDWFGPSVVTDVHAKIIDFSRTIFSQNAVEQIIEPTVNSILTVGKGEIVSVGFVISLWAGSSAMSSFVDAITVAHGQYGVRNEVWQRIFALLLYLVGLVGLVIGLPLVAIGPDLLVEFFPDRWRPTISDWVSTLYYPILALVITLALATLYKLALPRKLPWHRGVPGSLLAMVIFLLSSVGLRIYLSWITKTGYTYGALAAPIAFLLLMFFIGLAVVAGAYFNSAIQELWPAKMTRRQRRKWRRLEMERASERLRSDESRKLWDRNTVPLLRPRKNGGENGSEPEDSGPEEEFSDTAPPPPPEAGSAEEPDPTPSPPQH